MSRHLFSRLTLAAVAGAALALSALPAAANYSRVYAFGDSLSDRGNLYNATLSAYGVAGALPQAGDYFNGRFSNGQVAVEVLAQTLAVPLTDFAFGGAKTTADPTYAIPGGGSFSTGLAAQVALHDAALSNNADPTGLYFIWAGGNDLRDAFGQVPVILTDPTLTNAQKAAQLNATLTAATTTVYTNLATTVGHLYSEGARNFLLPTLPDFGLTPEGQAAQAAIPPALFSLSNFSTSFDAGLKATYMGLALPGATLTVFDTLSLQRDVYANPGSYGIGDVDTPCFLGYVGVAGTQCAAGFATTNMFWDKVHPSAVTHAVLGEAMAAAVPEPSSMLLLAMGVVGLLGWSRRRQA